MGHDNNAERSCERKRIYVTKKDAERALWLARKDFGDALLVIYRCHFCGAYHLGHWGGQQRLAKKAEKRKKEENGMTEDVAVLQQMVYDLQQEYPLRPTLLDQFAGQALIGLMACTNVYRAKKGNGDMETFQEFSARVAGNAYDAAEAMLRERANRMSLSGGATS